MFGIRSRILSSLVAFSIVVVSLTACSGNKTAVNEEIAKAQPSYANTSTPSTSNSTSMSGDMMSPLPSPTSRYEKSNGERYAQIDENPFLKTMRSPLSTFSVDVDTASYSNVRRYLTSGNLPPKDAVRIEELVNYFEYEYPQPVGNIPFSVNTESATCPWNNRNKIVSIGLQGKKIALDNVPPSNLVFLIDTSGSMNSPDKLPLLKDSFRILVNQLTEKDRIAIVTYAGSSGLALPSKSAHKRGEILSAIEDLAATGSTNGEQGIQLAYQIAQQNFIQNGNNRVILATDGDFNVGLTSDSELVNLIEQKRKSNIFLSVLGFGTGNINDSMMEKLADKGNGNYSYIDSADEARKALGAQVAGTLHTIAKDVKIQVEFNPEKVVAYRLIGYENRLLADKDFNDDKKDAGEIGAGHSVTALYEIVPAGQRIETSGGDELRYTKVQPSETRFNNELLTVKLRYKEPGESESRLITQGLLDKEIPIENASNNLKFASAVVEFGLVLRDSRYKSQADFDQAFSLASSAKGNDLKSYRAEFLTLIEKAKRIKKS